MKAVSGDRQRRALGPFLARCLGVIAIAVCVAALAPAPAAAKYATLVMDAESGRVLYSVNADTRNYPASLTKMMTLYMVFRALDEGRWSLDEHLPISARAARQPASKLGLARGRTVSVRDAIYALVTKSANDVATAIAEAMAGGDRNFARMMTAEARKLGMSRTTFRNSSGLPHSRQMSTARDMATLARALLTRYPHYYHYFATRHFTFDGVTHKNHNDLLSTYDGTDGLKTGYIRASGFNLVASAKRGDYRIIGVVFGGRSPRARNRHMVRILDKGFRLLGETGTARADAQGGKDVERLATAPATSPAANNPRRKTPRPGWGVQVGAYFTHAPAYAAARKAVARAPGYLEDGTIAVVPLKRKKGRTVFRARILDITKKEAYRACRVLKRRKMHCMELRMRPTQVAAARG
ncbi:MAG: D-alanyl-D-alanine carboxypeptidase family protein [Rhodospirillales bacterium]|nr:D-alanyl-D-alanine carboxypeptidase family protein [Rhodospirillales bacterium]